MVSSTAVAPVPDTVHPWPDPNRLKTFRGAGMTRTRRSGSHRPFAVTPSGDVTREPGVRLAPPAPCGPTSPVLPFGPWAPVSPFAPVAPVGPVAPAGPTGPAGPWA